MDEKKPIKFLHGRNLSNKKAEIDPGTIYLDIESNELWYDDPSGENQSKHIRLFNDLLDDIRITKSFQVQLGEGATIGGYTTGDTIPENATLSQVLQRLLQKAVPATYTLPTISLTNNGGTASGDVETGTMITPKLKVTGNQNDAGELTGIIFFPPAITVNGVTSTLSTNEKGDQATWSPSFVISDETQTFSVSVNYADAPVKKNNLGEDSKENWFPGGTLTKSYSITGKRKLFYGAGEGSLPTITSDLIRGLSGKTLGPANGTSFTINVAVGQQYIVIAYPESLRDINNITYVEANDKNMAQNFIKSIVNVADARGGANGVMRYKVYTYEMAVPAAAPMTFTVKI